MQKKMQNLDVEPNKDTSTKTEASENVETEWPHSNVIDLYALASAAGRLAGNLNTKPGALDDFFSKLKILEHEWHEAEKRYQRLKTENDRLTNQLIHERTKCAIYQKKLKFIQENQKNFEKLKEVYLSMQNQETTLGTKSSVQLCEQSVQTIDFDTASESQSLKSASPSIISTCDKDSLTKYHGSVIQSDSMISIKRSELSEAQENLQLLKEMIRRREYTWSVNIQREEALKEEIKNLEQDKQALEATVKLKDIELKSLKGLKSDNPDEQTISNMKRIIGKMSRRLKELEPLAIKKSSTTFNEKEKEMVQLIENITASQKKLPPKNTQQSVKPKLNKNISPACARKPVRNIKQPLSPIIEAKSKSVIESSEEYDSDVQELELLGEIKRSIEAKQAALKEKVQQIINSSEQHRTILNR